MKKLVLRIFCLSILVLFVSGCYHSMQSVYGGCSLPSVEPDENSQNGYGIVYFVRESRMNGALEIFDMYENSNLIGFLRSGSYFIHKAKVGKQTYWAKSQSNAFATLDIEAGETYYVMGGISVGMVNVATSLNVISEGYAHSVLPEFKCYIKVEDMQQQAGQ